jgi:hypothetical protein
MGPASLAQKLGQLQFFTAVFPPECTGQLPSFGPTYHLSRFGPTSSFMRPASLGPEIDVLCNLLYRVLLFNAILGLDFLGAPCPGCRFPLLYNLLYRVLLNIGHDSGARFLRAGPGPSRRRCAELRAQRPAGGGDPRGGRRWPRAALPFWTPFIIFHSWLSIQRQSAANWAPLITILSWLSTQR